MPVLITPLVPIDVASIYNKGPLPSRTAKCTPDTAATIQAVVDDLRGLGHELRLSDLFRSREMQQQAHLDFTEGRKTAFSPPPGGSMREAGREMDIDLSSIGVPLNQFWEIARSHGFSPIVDSPDPSRSEAWHFGCRGSHDVVHQYVKQGKVGALSLTGRWRTAASWRFACRWTNCQTRAVPFCRRHSSARLRPGTYRRRDGAANSKGDSGRRARPE